MQEVWWCCLRTPKYLSLIVLLCVSPMWYNFQFTHIWSLLSDHIFQESQIQEEGRVRPPWHFSIQVPARRGEFCQRDTVSQERSQPMIRCKRDFFAKILLSQPYMQENDSVSIICLGFWGFLTTHPGSKFPNQKIVFTHRIQSHYFVINPPQSVLYTSTGVYINHYMA